MSCAAGPDINENGLVLALDAANTKSILSAVEVLVVAGGGGGGNHVAGGGGAGGLIYNQNFAVTPGSPLTVTIGAGGAATSYGGGNGGNGGNSVFDALTAIGGGGGGSYANNGSSGGSGGGSNNWSVSATGGTGTSGQGFAGGSNNGQTNFGGGGGGAGGTAKGLSNNSGGDGLLFNISGIVTYYAGGGGAGVYPGYTNDTSYGYGGLGGGGNGGNGPHGSGTAPTAGGTNTGGGGGGVSDYLQTSAAGGSGIVIVRYPGAQRATGGTVTSVGGYTIHTFTTSGTFAPTWGDLSGSGNTGTLTNGPTYNSANSGSIVFDGSNDFVTTANTTISGSQTFSVWAMVTGGPDAPAGILTQHNYASTANFGINHVGANKLAPSIGYTNGTREYNAKVTNFTITNDVIFNAVLVYNSSENKIYWYINGQLDSSYTLSATPKSTNYPICLGRWDGGFAAYYFNGRVYSGNIHNRALTAAEVSQNYNALRGRYGI